MTRCGYRVAAKMSTCPIPTTYLDLKPVWYSVMHSIPLASRTGGAHLSPGQTKMSSNLYKTHLSHGHIAIDSIRETLCTGC